MSETEPWMGTCFVCKRPAFKEELTTYGNRCGSCYDHEYIELHLNRKEIVKAVNKLKQLRGTKKLIRSIEVSTGFNRQWFEV